MPVKFCRKQFENNGIYHIYNRGIDKIQIFPQGSDYDHYIDLLKRYLETTEGAELSIYKQRPYQKRHAAAMNLREKIRLLAYCLMPDHLHLLVRQENSQAMTQLMRRVGTGYVMYFNKKYHRRGPLFEGVYRGVQVKEGEKTVWISRMIHLNPLTETVRRFGPVETVTGKRPEEYLYSSIRDYFGYNNNAWVHPEEVLVEFEKINQGKWKDYRSLVTDHRMGVTSGVGELMLD